MAKTGILVAILGMALWPDLERSVNFLMRINLRSKTPTDLRSLFFSNEYILGVSRSESL